MSIFEPKIDLENNLPEEDNRKVIPEGYRSLNLVTITGTRSFHYFRNDSTGDTVRVSCTNAEYDSYGTAGAGQPSNGAGYTWLYSSKEPEYSGANGDLNDNEYAVLPVGDVVVRLPENSPYQVEQVNPADMVDDAIDLLEYRAK